MCVGYTASRKICEVKQHTVKFEFGWVAVQILARCCRLGALMYPA